MKRRVAANSGDKQQLFSASDHVRSTWNQVKFGWALNIPPSLDNKSPVYFLGCAYTHKGYERSESEIHGNFKDFTNDFYSRLWFTYRENFAPLCKPVAKSLKTTVMEPDTSECSHYEILDHSMVPGTESQIVSNGFPVPPVSCDSLQSTVNSSWINLSEASDTGASSSKQKVPLSIQTSDCGWGCALRSGQMLLAQALVVHLLGRRWRTPNTGSAYDAVQQDLHRRIIRWFHDSWSQDSPFSIHRIVEASNVLPGNWFGPSTVCFALVKVMRNVQHRIAELNNLQIYMAKDGVIYRKEVLQLARGNPVSDNSNRIYRVDHTGSSVQPSTSSSLNESIVDEDVSEFRGSHRRFASFCSTANTNAVIIFIPLRLGLDKYVNPIYLAMLRDVFRDPCCIGALGGRPKHSIYIVGSHDKRFIYIDPHFCQPTISVQDDTFSTNTWHCRYPRLISASKVDPCCTIGFYCSSQGELRDLLDRLPNLLSARDSSGNNSTSVIGLVDSDPPVISDTAWDVV